MEKKPKSTWGVKADTIKKAERPTKETIFKPLQELAKKRKLKVGLWGDTEGGKTHFIMTCPEPIYIIGTEEGITPLAWKFKGRNINVVEAFIVNPQTDKADPIKSLELVSDAIDSLKDVSEGTIAIDSGSDIWFWEECRMKEIVGEIGRRTMQFDWKIANQHYGELIMKLLSREVVFVITGRPKEIYSGSQSTGTYEAKWQGNTKFWVDVVLRMEKLKYGVAPKAGEPSTKTRYVATIDKCRYERQFDLQITDLNYDKLYEVLKKYL